MEIGEKAQRFWKRLIMISGAVAALLLCAAVLYRWNASRRVDRELERIRNAGEPQDLTMIERAQLLRATNDAARLIKLAIQSQVQSTNITYEKIREDWDEDHAFTTEMRLGIRGLLEKNEQSLSHLREALTNSHLILPLNWHSGYAMLVPHLVKFRQFAQLLTTAALLEIETGNREQAQQVLNDVLRLGSFLQDEPLLVSQMVRFSVTGLGLQLLEDLLAGGDIPEERARAFQMMLRSGSNIAFLRNALFVERVAGLDFYEQAPKVLGLSDLGQAGYTLLNGLGWVNTDKAFYLQGMHEMINVCGTPYPEALQHAQSVEQRYAQETPPDPRKQSRFDLFRMQLPRVSGMILPPQTQVFEKHAAHLARTRLGIAALELNVIRQKNGAHPRALPLDSEPEPGDFSDPFTGRPLRLKPTEHGFMVYSAGPDRVDNGGIRGETGPPWLGGAPPDNLRKNQSDLVFQVGRPQH